MPFLLQIGYQVRDNGLLEDVSMTDLEHLNRLMKVMHCPMPEKSEQTRQMVQHRLTIPEDHECHGKWQVLLASSNLKPLFPTQRHACVAASLTAGLEGLASNSHHPEGGPI